MEKGLYIGVALLMTFVVFSMVRCGFLQHKLGKYLREKHFEKWKYLTTVLGFGPGFANGIKGMKFLFSNEDCGDPEVLKLKVAVRNSLIYVITGMLAAPIFLFFFLVFFGGGGE